ncbi:MULTISPECIES: hemin uptake protein HemP [Janthinobacterium]|jgi:hemin uptake protein HemP|uniref:hemin uptake protein HemP n=1 Tax=Janthinobacterium TaxID=29580 RepID=UPI00140CED56|nr:MULTISPECIES: hemin uptake protein HemP [Janthinobacterium]NBV17403.1 hemin uptake protein HemP [Janthinobacterium sp.]NHQ93722.1 hemin uptake protein HemP [Janthinobacterium lividum]
MQSSKPALIQDAATAHVRPPVSVAQPARRITSEALLQQGREVEIEHSGKIYRLRVTQLNKLILTA